MCTVHIAEYVPKVTPREVLRGNAHVATHVNQAKQVAFRLPFSILPAGVFTSNAQETVHQQHQAKLLSMHRQSNLKIYQIPRLPPQY